MDYRGGGDVVFYVGGQAFVANRSAVAAASPYLGSVLMAAPSTAHVTLPPLVPPDVFSALMAGVADKATLRRALTDTNVEQVKRITTNIFHVPLCISMVNNMMYQNILFWLTNVLQMAQQVLVGAQLLQMHDAAAECKDFLARTRAQQPRQRYQQQECPTILKPIPSRPNFGTVGGEGFLMAAAAAALAWRNAWVRSGNN